MTTIPASQIVTVIPSVLGATGNGLIMNGLMLTTSWRVPNGNVQSFAMSGSSNPAQTLSAFFGSGSPEYAKGTIYANGFVGASQLPGALLVAQFTSAAVGAWLLGGPFSQLTISQIQGITSGSLSLVMDGYTRTVASLNLSSASSYSAAAGLIQTAFNTSLPAGGVSAAAGGSIAAVTSSFTASISGNVLTVTGAPTNLLVAGTLLTGTGVTAGTQIQNQLSNTTGSNGGAGTYAINTAQLVASETMTGTYGILTLAGSNASGTFSVGQSLTGGTTSVGTQIWQLGTGSGAAGTYYVSPSQTVSAATITGTGTAITVTFDSVSGGLLINSGIVGVASTTAFMTGTLAATLFLTAQTGATNSQGGAGLTPSQFMNNVVNQTQNWASFFNLVDPDDGAVNGPGQKLLFAAWNSAQNSRYAYIAWDTDLTPTTSNQATSSLGYQINQTFLYNGTTCIYDPTNEGQAAFMSGSIASINFNQTNGRADMAFRSQSGIGATVTSLQVSTNLAANGYNWYGAYATANQQFQFFYPGTVSGQFLWLDSYVNQIYMNSQFQLNLVELLTQVLSIPYNNVGYAMIEAACIDVINQMLNFGAIRTGVTLSSLEVVETSNLAGFSIAQTLQVQGWFFQVQPATAAIRQARSSPTCLFFYTDGQSVQKIVLNSILLL